ncbi:L-lactate dehydrogenase [Oscillatoria sp. FACHB-1407]|uniref:L-lactate dehydrogenase n=1 Tax=Oscillatoria sp. FACHB-1407 TaxID=2692847 RepID=UPI001687484C|nr:L-lactate dehydrogenase [Oscillatoria sp. FACHB-1407]MBD2461807.1 L-lactate dehydrogenase [Oscillatoria sp. FACHB-1407]
MFENFFVAHPSSDLQIDPIRPRKGMIIGAGQVGMACAYSMLIQNTLDEMVLVDVAKDKLEGEVMDLVHGLPFVEPTAVRGGAIADGAGADIVVVTAGVGQKPGESRLSLVQRNVELLKKLIPEIVQHCPNAILLMVSNPVDILTYAALKLSNLPSSRVIGSGTVLDTARFRYLLAQKLQIDPRSLHAYVIGEHGDSEVPVWSRLNVAGTPLYEAATEENPDADQAALQEVFVQVKNAAYEIIQRKGYTSYAIGLAVTQIVQAILRNQNRVLTVSSLMNGVNGLQDVCLSLPSVVNRQGVTRVLKTSLSDREHAQLQQSAQTLKQVIEQLDL